MKSCRVRDLNIGEGKPKVCIPLVGKNDQEILDQADSFQQFEYDLVELRIDFYEYVLDSYKVIVLLKALREIIDKPIVLTYRSLREGGQVQLTDEQYIDLIQNVSQSQLVDLIDIELMSGTGLVYKLVDIVHKNHIQVIMSNHDFEKTPSVSDMMDTLERMEILGGDILKIAVMPLTYKDVIHLLNMTLEMSHKLSKPIVTMSMGNMGSISRITGELTGSSITFASATHSSAPGQIGAKEIQLLLEAIHCD